MTSFDRYSKGGVYGLHYGNGGEVTLIAMASNGEAVEGYPVDAIRQDDGPDTIRVGSNRTQVRILSVNAKSRIGSIRTFDRFEFPDGPVNQILLQIPEDKRDAVDVTGGFEYKPVSCPCDDPDDGWDGDTCDWEGDLRQTIAGDRCPQCGSTVDDPSGGGE